MNETRCGEMRELLPLHAAGVLSDSAEFEAHVSTCDDCRAELALVHALLSSRPSAPAGLADQIALAVRSSRRQRAQPWWGLTAAAVAALALGIGVTSSSVGPVDVMAPEFATELEEEDLWVSGDGLLAGAPALEALSDEALEQLLDELEFDGDGGSA